MCEQDVAREDSRAIIMSFRAERIMNLLCEYGKNGEEGDRSPNILG